VINIGGDFQKYRDFEDREGDEEGKKENSAEQRESEITKHSHVPRLAMQLARVSLQRIER
jgi:hypothetical protein